MQNCMIFILARCCENQPVSLYSNSHTWEIWQMLMWYLNTHLNSFIYCVLAKLKDFHTHQYFSVGQSGWRWTCCCEPFLSNLVAMATEEKKPDTEATKTQPASAASASQSKVKTSLGTSICAIVFGLVLDDFYVVQQIYRYINGIAALLLKCAYLWQYLLSLLCH